MLASEGKPEDGFSNILRFNFAAALCVPSIPAFHRFSEIMDIQIYQIEFGTPEYDEAVGLRYEVLRKPLGLEYTTEQLAAEYDQIHLAAYGNGGILLAYLNLTPADPQVVKMRQVAVAPAQQGKGIGARLVAESERVARSLGFHVLLLHARETAVPFYEHLGYAQEGDRFEEVGIPHYKMKKDLY